MAHPLPQATPSLAPATDVRTRRGLIYAKLYYLCLFGAIGAFAPYFNIILEARGLSGTQIGWLGSIPPLVALLAGPIWGGVADRWQIHRLVLAGCALAAGVISLLFLHAATLAGLMLLVIALFCFRTPVVAILDGAVVELALAGRTTYARQRLWGSVGFILMTYLVGRVVAGGNRDAVFWVHGALLGICAGLSLLLPISRTGEAVNLYAGLRQLLGQHTYRNFLLAVVFLGIGAAGFMNFLGLYMLALGGTAAHVGAAFALNSVAEIPIMYLGGAWFIRYGNALLLRISVVGFAFTWFVMALARSPIQLVVATSCMGVCFGLFWIAAVGFADEHAPAGLSATGQALMGAALWGLGWAIGALLAGVLWQNTNGHILFLVLSGFAAIAAAILYYGRGNKKRA